MIRLVNKFMLLCLLLLPTSCMEWDYGLEEEFDVSASGEGLFICNEGNFQYGNATLSYYDPATKTVQNEVFYRANAMKLGDVCQSMIIRDGIGWVVVNNSHVIFAIDINTFKEVGRITNLTSPRYIHFLSDEKAYVTQIWDNRIFIVNPKRYEITGYIDIPNMTMESGSTEQMVQLGKYLYVNCWSYQNRILKIDTETDQVVDELVVGIQPTSLVMDCNNKLWTVTDGGYEGSPYGHEAHRSIASTLMMANLRWRSSSNSILATGPRRCNSTVRKIKSIGSTMMFGRWMLPPTESPCAHFCPTTARSTMD